jgi:glycosyltransferase involved in cell wall biosynthesis
MRISIVSGTFHPEAGGPPTYLKRLAESLVSRGHRVRVATYGDSEPHFQYPYPVKRISREQPIPLRIARLTWLAWTDARGADLIFANDYGLPPLLANTVARKPLVMKIVSDFAGEFGVRHGLIPAGTTIDAFQGATLPARLELLRRVQSEYARRADAVIVPSRYLGDMVLGWGVHAERVHVLHNAVEVPVEGSVRSRADLDLPLAGHLVVTAARLVPWKGVDTLLRAVAQLRASGNEVALAVIGGGEERPRLEQLASQLGIRGNVHFTGEVPQPDVATYLRCADVFALASTYEGFSHVLLEALAVGVPVVATRVGGNPEVVMDGENGLLVPHSNVEDMASALARVLGDDALRERLAEAGRRTLLEFSWASLLARTEALFCDVIARRSGAVR